MPKQVNHQTVPETTLVLKLGKTRDEQIHTLEKIKSSMVQVLMAGRTDDTAFDESTMDFAEYLYTIADGQVSQLASCNQFDFPIY